MTTPPFDHTTLLQVLARVEGQAVTACAEALLPQLPEIQVLHNRTGLVMLPMRDTAQGTAFHLGEVLVAEAHIRADGAEGYGMRRGRDLTAAMAMAVVDLAWALEIGGDAIRAFVSDTQALQADEDRETLRRVEATRVDMETF